MWSNNFLRTIIIVVCFLSTTNIVFAQLQQERRVYYLDCSYSMKSLKIWDKVRENLKTAIDNVGDETTELIVIPFTDRRVNHFPLPVYTEFATLKGKQNLMKAIDGMICDKACNTVHNVPFSDFISNRIDSSKITYMFLMTDGQNELEIPEFEKSLNQWGNRFGNKNVYGFYVMLHKDAKNPKIEQIIKQQEHLWKVETADVNINLIRFDDKATFNIRGDKFVEIPIYGKIDSKSIQLEMESNDCYEIEHYEILSNNLRIYIKGKKSQSLIPDLMELDLKPTYIGNGNYTFIVSDNIMLTCMNKKERSLRISIR